MHVTTHTGFDMSTLLELIVEYGNEKATKAYHGELHCRRLPVEILDQIKAILDTQQPPPEYSWSADGKTVTLNNPSDCPEVQCGAVAKRYALSPDNGLMYESDRGAWIRYADATQQTCPDCAELGADFKTCKGIWDAHKTMLQDNVAKLEAEVDQWRNGGYTNLWKQRTEDRDKTIESQRLILLDLRDKVANLVDENKDLCDQINNDMEDTHVGKALRRVIEELPTRFDLSVEVAHGKGLVRLFVPSVGDDDMSQVLSSFGGKEHFSDEIIAALDQALEIKKEQDA